MGLRDNCGVRDRGPGDIEPPIEVTSVYGVIVRDCLYVRARGLRDREGEGYAPGVHRMSDRATRQRVGDARLRNRERESCIPRINHVSADTVTGRAALKINRVAVRNAIE